MQYEKQRDNSGMEYLVTGIYDGLPTLETAMANLSSETSSTSSSATIVPCNVF